MNLKDLEARKNEFEVGIQTAQKQIDEHKNSINNLSARILATKGAIEDIDYWIASLKKESGKLELTKKQK